MNNGKIPKALCNDNFIGYVHEFIVQQRVTWLEATIAAPVFCDLVTYYLEGDQGSKWGNLMDTLVGKAPRSWGVRGNIVLFYFHGKMCCNNCLVKWKMVIFHTGHCLQKWLGTLFVFDLYAVPVMSFSNFESSQFVLQ